MEERKRLLKELRILEDLEYASRYDGKQYSFLIEEDGMIRDHIEYPELRKVFPGPQYPLGVPAEELHEYFKPFSPSLIIYINWAREKVDLPGTTNIVIDWSNDEPVGGRAANRPNDIL